MMLQPTIKRIISEVCLFSHKLWVLFVTYGMTQAVFDNKLMENDILELCRCCQQQSLIREVL